MNKERINAALRDAPDTQRVLIGEGVLFSVGEVFGECFGNQPAVVVADENTWAVAGEEVHRRLQSAGCKTLEPYVFPGKPTLYADYANTLMLVEMLRSHDAIPVAVGSGTLNDLVKRASYECERPYMCVGTAASMDGYTAFGASIEKDNKKQTLTCPAPRVVVGDVNILVNAPARMTASGYADLLGKVTAGADWIVADALEVEPISMRVWSLVQDSLREWVGRPAGLRAGDREAMDKLIEGLIMSGLAMQAHRSSRPASGAEHQFSHLWEGEGLGRALDPPLSHGFKVGVGSISIAALYERILERDLSDLDVDVICNGWPTWEEVDEQVRASYSGSKLEEAAVGETRAKYVDADRLRERLTRLRNVWPELREKVKEQLIPTDELRGMLEAAGCPTDPIGIGLSWEDFKATYRRAQMLRKRYTILDLANETGILDECVEELFAPGGFWARDAASQT
ncbi:MAG: sn-glycerol-1-phosphate dehydrogenase [Rubrobacteraceae bacterium]|nr:sn-glycerol-1-phosphate dehydrogenase [Rubrobacteraceae bacterium]